MCSYGHGCRLTSLYPVDLGVTDFQANHDETARRLIRAGGQAIEQDFAEALILGCTMEMGFYKDVEAALGVPVIDAAIAALKRAEYGALLKRQCGWIPSRKWSCEPPPEEEIAKLGCFEGERPWVHDSPWRLPRLRLDWLRAFRAVMQAGTVTGAASIVLRTQPQVSRMIANLEAGLALKLFRREGRRLIPTEQALQLLQYIEPLMLGLDASPMPPRTSGTSEASGWSSRPSRSSCTPWSLKRSNRSVGEAMPGSLSTSAYAALASGCPGAMRTSA